MTSAAQAVLEARGLCVDLPARGGRRAVLQDIGFVLPRRGVLGVIGESGSGKSVLARTLCNWVEPPLAARGQVLFGGSNLLGTSAAAMHGVWGRRLAYIGADPGGNFDPTQPVGEQIVEKLRCVEPALGRTEAMRRVIELLGEVRIPEPRSRFNDLPHRFSGGMLQRAAIVDALITDPEVLVADSIVQSLDVTVAAQIVALLHALRARFHTAIVYVSPSLAAVRELADDVLVLAAGRVVERSAVATLVACPQHAYTQRLIAQTPRIWAEAPAAGVAAQGMPLLRVEGVHKAYVQPRPGTLFGRQHVQAVRGVSFEVRRGESFGIVGESGCGKSTLSRLLTGLEAPDAGRITFDGADVATMPERQRLGLRRRFQLVLPDPYHAIPAHWPIGRIVAEPLRIHGSNSPERTAVLAAMAEAGLPAGWFERLPGGLSAGQRQRVNLARALVLQPELLILDETLSALDPTDQFQLLELFERLKRTRGLSYIFITHDLGLVRRMCDRIAVMYLGRIVELGANRPTFFEPLHPYTRALLAAMPVLEPGPFERGEHLREGETPSPIDLPAGCSFASRCPQAHERCRVEDPVLRRLGERAAACHLAG